jgi:hypothetical protein
MSEKHGWLIVRESESLISPDQTMALKVKCIDIHFVFVLFYLMTFAALLFLVFLDREIFALCFFGVIVELSIIWGLPIWVH